MSNSGTDRVIDLIRPGIGSDYQLDMLAPALSLFAFAKINREARGLAGYRPILPLP